MYYGQFMTCNLLSPLYVKNKLHRLQYTFLFTKKKTYLSIQVRVPNLKSSIGKETRNLLEWVPLADHITLICPAKVVAIGTMNYSNALTCTVPTCRWTMR